MQTNTLAEAALPLSRKLTTRTGRTLVAPRLEASNEQCPACLAIGIPVPADVLSTMLPRAMRKEARAGYRFCPTAGCSVVYHDNHAESYIDVTEVNKLVSLKDPGPEAPICYCLNVSRGAIQEAVRDGRVHSSEDAKRVLRACTGKACHVVNPAGICCGDQLRDTVAAALESKGARRTMVRRARHEDPGASCCGRTLSKVISGDAPNACEASDDACAC